MRAPAAEDLILARLAALGRALPGAGKGEGPALHHARVATRRLREALPLLAVGPKSGRLARDVRRLTRALGPARELDVAFVILDDLEQAGGVSRQAIQSVRLALADERRRALADLQHQLDGFDMARLRKRALAAVRKPTDRTPKRTLDQERVEAARRRTGQRAERVARSIDSAAGLYLPDRLHEVRIAVKKLRYTLELEPRATAAASGRLRLLRNAQVLLGRMHDLEVLIARARAVQSSPGASTLKVSAELDRLVRRLETECRQLHGRYMASRAEVVRLCHRLIARAEGRRPIHRSAA